MTQDALPAWNLDSLYPGPDSREFTSALERLEKQTLAFAEKWRGRLARADGEQLAEAIEEYEALSDLSGRIASYAFLYYAGETTDPARASFFGNVQGRLTEISTHALFFELELNRIDDKALEEKLKDKRLARFAPWLADIRRERPHQLAEDLERLFHEKSLTSTAAFNRLFDETMAALRFDVDGEMLGQEQTLALLQSPDRSRRQSAYGALAQTLADNIALFSRITNTLAKDRQIEDNWRKFSDPADFRHLANRVEPETVAALTEAVTSAYPRLSHRYYAMKARWLGLEKLAAWDRNAPLPEADTAPIPWEEAKRTVLEAYGAFHPPMADLAKDFFERAWIDAQPRPGKQGGAFAHPTTPSANPYVLLHYQGKPRDVMTLAHELGHGVHQRLAAGQGSLMAPTPLTLAETASVFGEMLTFRSLLDKAETPGERKALLAGKAEDMLNTVVRQIAFYLFERKVHAAIRAHGEQTPDDIAALWMETQAESLGPAVELREGYEVLWSYVPHFVHAPFYVYAYAFGDCLVNALYAEFERNPEGFQERYFDLLKAGGSRPYHELLQTFGLDARDPAFWAQGLSVIEGLIDELETLET